MSPLKWHKNVHMDNQVLVGSGYDYSAGAADGPLIPYMVDGAHFIQTHKKIAFGRKICFRFDDRLATKAIKNILFLLCIFNNIINIVNSRVMQYGTWNMVWRKQNVSVSLSIVWNQSPIRPMSNMHLRYDISPMTATTIRWIACASYGSDAILLMPFLLPFTSQTTWTREKKSNKKYNV